LPPLDKEGVVGDELKNITQENRPDRPENS